MKPVLQTATIISSLVLASASFAQGDAAAEASTGEEPPVVQYNETDRFELATETTTPFRTDTFTIRVGGLTENFGALEYKVTMQEGDVLVYTWTAPLEIYYEAHGHPQIVPNAETVDVFYYGRGNATTRSGSFQAAVDGIHGWFFANPDIDPIEIEVTLAGFYELEPGIIGPATP